MRSGRKSRRVNLTVLLSFKEKTDDARACPQSGHCPFKRWWDEIKGLSGVRCTNNWTQEMLCDQKLSIDALADRFSTFLGSPTANFTLLVAHPLGSSFTVPELLLVDNYTVYKSLSRTSPSVLTLYVELCGRSSLFNFHLLAWTSTTHR